MVRWLPDTPLLVPRDSNHVDSIAALPELHTLRSSVSVDGRNWLKCSCGHVRETFGPGYRITCPMDDIQADLQEAIRRTTKAYDEHAARWRANSDRAEAELADALAGERR